MTIYTLFEVCVTQIVTSGWLGGVSLRPKLGYPVVLLPVLGELGGN